MVFASENDFAQYIHQLGGHAWLVGGAVRDQLLNIECTDKDYFITGLSPDELPIERIAGSQFPVFLIKIDKQICEVALARTERKISIGHKGFEFNTSKHLTASEDLARRDLTINSMAINLISNELIDPFNGQADLNAKLIRHTTDAFSEDPLRVYRAARFAARYHFEIHQDTLTLMHSLKNELKSLPSERILLELEKCFKTPNSSAFFEALKQCNCLPEHFEHLSALNDEHYQTLKLYIDKCDTPDSKWLLLCYVLEQNAEAFSNHLKTNNRYKKLATLSAHISNFLSFDQLSTSKQWQLLLKFQTERKTLFNSLKVLTNTNNIAFIQTCFEHFDTICKDVTAKALIEQGLQPGPALGEALLKQRLLALQTTINITLK
jgi:tRNA nucleotidyltransferase/poly(A) polymerase